MIKKIGFRNFRRFVNFPPIQLGEITLITGKNNSGKSTVVKSALLMLDYLKNQQADVFSFTGEMQEEANIVTFDRALCSTQPDRFIEFFMQWNAYTIRTRLTGEHEIVDGRTLFTEITYAELGLTFLFDYEKQAMSIRKKDKNGNKIFQLCHSFQSPESNKYLKKNFQEALDEFIYIHERELRSLLSKPDLSSVEKEYQQDLIEFEKYLFELKDTIRNFNYSLDNTYVYYWGAEPQRQSALFFLRDKRNDLAQAIHHYYQLKIQKEDKDREYLRYLMKEFEIGDDFEIKFHAGEAYEFIIKENKRLVNLADKGMGSVQIMTLLIRLITILHMHPGKTKNTTLIIEEPELNLHPALQSKLADLFYQVNKELGVRFIIETHSEYFIRKSQVLVNREEYKSQQEVDEKNRFKVYYFPKGELPYSMDFCVDGRFKNEFASGFFDESSNLAFEIL